MRRKARESKVERILRLIAWPKIGKNGVFFVKRARCNPRFSHLGALVLSGVLSTPALRNLLVRFIGGAQDNQVSLFFHFIFHR